MNTRQHLRFVCKVALLVPMVLVLLVAMPKFVQAGDPPPTSVTDRTEVLDSKTEKVPNPAASSSSACDRITSRLKVTPPKGEPMFFTEQTILCPNPVPKPQSRNGNISILGVSSMVQYAPPPSYTCNYAQSMWSGWTTDVYARWWMWYSYYNRSTGTYGSFWTSNTGQWNLPTTFTHYMGNSNANVRLYAATFQTNPAAISSGNGTGCY